MTEWKKEFIRLYRRQEEQRRLPPTPERILEDIAGLAEDIVNGKSREHSGLMFAMMLTLARDPLPVLELLNEDESRARAKL